MHRFVLLITVLLVACAPRHAVDLSPDRTTLPDSKFALAIEPDKVGTYPALVKSGAGYFYDDVLEYRVWMHPERGAERKSGGDDFFRAFAQFERALEFSRKTAGAEEPLVVIRQMKHINEPSPGVFEIVEGERIAEWQVLWLDGHKRGPGSLERFLQEHKR